MKLILNFIFSSNLIVLNLIPHFKLLLIYFETIEITYSNLYFELMEILNNNSYLIRQNVKKKFFCGFSPAKMHCEFTYTTNAFQDES